MRNPFRRREEETRSVTELPWNIGAMPGIGRVTPERALRLGPVFAVGRILAGAISSMPLQQYRRVGDDARQQVPLASLFRSPSAVGTLHDWVFRAVTSLVYRGNVVGLVAARDYYEFPTAIEWLHPDNVEVLDTAPSGPGSFTNPTWFYRGRQLAPEDVVHIPWFPTAGRVWGLAPLEAYAAAVSTGLGAQQYAADWFDKGGVPPGTFKNDEQTVDQAESEVIKRRLVSSIRSHEPIVFGKDWTYTPIAITPNQAQFVETMRLTASQIAAIYGVPPEMIGGDMGGSMTYANVEQNSLNFVQFTLLPWLTKLECAFSALLPQPQYVKFNADALVRTDIATRFDVYETARRIGVMNADEIRAKEDMAPLPNGQGQDYTPLVTTTKATPIPQPDPMPQLKPGQYPMPRIVRGAWEPTPEQKAIDGA